MNINVWVVSYWEEEKDPIVTVFDNEKAAKNFFIKQLIDYPNHCCIDECPVYSHFSHSMSEG